MPGRRQGACEEARAWLSAYRDAETADDEVAREHVRACPACTRWSSDLDRVTRRARLRSRPGPDVVSPALAAWGAPERGRGPHQERVARVVLVLSGVGGLALAALGLFEASGHAQQAGWHLGWELYSFDAALALGFLLAARAPGRYLAGLLPVTLAVALLHVVPGAGLVASGNVDLLREASHVPVLTGLVGLLLLVDARGWGRERRSRSRHTRPAVA